MANKMLGEKLRQLRNDAGYTQQQVADIIGLKNKSTLGTWEIGKAEPDAYTFLRLCAIYNVINIYETFEDIPATHDIIDADCFSRESEMNIKQSSKDISFSSRLKELRIIAGKTVAEVSSFLICRGIKATDKTIYSWESGRSRPTADTLLLLCDFYGVSNVLSAFGYGKIENDGISFQLTPDERNLVSDYRELSEQGQEYIRQTMYMARQNFKKASASDDSAV